MRAFTSFEQIIRETKAVITRFPLAMAVALIGTTIGIMFMEAGEPSSYIRPLLVLALGFPLFTALVFLSEERQFEKSKKILANGAAIIFLVAYYFLLPPDIDNAPQLNIIRYLLWAIGFVLLVTFISFLKKSGGNIVQAFWQFNKVLIYLLILTGVWVVALQAGISIALASIDFLFKVGVPDQRYMELWIVIIGIFGTIFFLSRVPHNFYHTFKTEEYPKELRSFSTYVLVPLVALYFLILYAYVVQILVMWQWPEGTLAYMILGFSLLGILLYVCLYPIREKLPWTRNAGTIFYVALIPQVGMLFWALWFRISQYGFTENRYFVFIFGWWLLAMALYFLMSAKKDIRIIPITLFCMALLSSFGPWGVFAVSERSQENRLGELLVKNNLLVNNKIQKSTAEVPFDDRKEISAILEYLDRTHGLEGIQEWVNGDFSAVNKSSQEVAEKLMGIKYVDKRESNNAQNKYFYFSSKYSDSQLLDISDYDYMKRSEGTARDTIEVNGAMYVFEVNNQGAFVVRNGGEVIAEIDLNPLLDNLFKQGNQKNVDGNYMKIVFKNNNISLAFHLNHISGQRKEDNSHQIDSINGILLFSL